MSELLDDVAKVFEIFRTADPKISDVTVAGWLARNNQALVIPKHLFQGSRSDHIEASPLVWLAWGGDKELVMTLARRAAAPLAW